MRETELYAPIRDYLTANGYIVRGEVKNCDITAVSGDDLIVIELKTTLSLPLILQAVERQRRVESVYVAVPRNAAGLQGKKRWTMFRLLKRLELGLILVAMDAPPYRVEVAFHPIPYEQKRRKSDKRAILTEIAGRSGDYNEGGSTRRALMTAYRENVIRVACYLARLGPSTPKVLGELETGPKTLSILSSNFYGWFERVERGVYTINNKGREALESYPDLRAHFERDLDEKLATSVPTESSDK
jgi:hypothetical protein